MQHRFAPPVLAALLLVTALAAAPVTPASAQDLGFRGWGPRVGVGDDPDQVLIGAHVDFGTFVSDLRFQPSAELGFGDDHTIFSVTAPVHWMFRIDGDFTPYAGGGVLVSFIDSDHPRQARSTQELDISPVVVGGLEWPLRTTSVFVELNLAAGDTHSARLWLGWKLR